MTEPREIGLRIPVLARVEGEGALDLTVQDGRIAELKLRIFEPPRLFEKFLEGRSLHEVPDMVARICGICPVAYQMSAVQALENICGVTPTPWIREMRRLFYCGEWIESHALHIHLLAAPDFFGFGSVAELAQAHPAEVKRGLALQELGNELIRLLGRRSVHPVGARVGGFYRAPDRAAVGKLLARLRNAIPEAEALVRWVARLPLPAGAQDFEYVSLRHASEYPMNEGRLVSNLGLDIAPEAFEQEFGEIQVPHSTALHCLHRGRPYLVGPLARLNLNFDRLPATVLAAATATGIDWPSRNPFHSIVARAVEILYALHEAVRILEHYAVPGMAYLEVVPREGTGFGCTEAPRGILWHRYALDGQERVVAARIVPPTSQNQARIEADLRQALETYGLQRTDAELRLRAESVIRNYDPCISCATHFLDLRVRRG